jgi:hypothetical protein
MPRVFVIEVQSLDSSMLETVFPEPKFLAEPLWVNVTLKRDVFTRCGGACM